MTQEKTSAADKPGGGEPLAADDAAENIPVLQETVESDWSLDHDDLAYAAEPEPNVTLSEPDLDAQRDDILTLSLGEAILDEGHSHKIATLEAIVFDGEDPAAPAPTITTSTDHSGSGAAASTHPSAQAAPNPPPVTTKPLPQKSENPFLPQHILDRLNQGKRNLVEEIAQSGAALDASTAILRTRARADRLQRPSFSEPNTTPTYQPFARDKSAYKKQQIIDDLVDEYLPLLASELRRRLRKILDE